MNRHTLGTCSGKTITSGSGIIGCFNTTHYLPGGGRYSICPRAKNEALPASFMYELSNVLNASNVRTLGIILSQASIEIPELIV